MKKIPAYKTSDGRIFEDEDAAAKHQKDIIGECLDDLLMDDSRGNVTRMDRFSMLVRSMDDPGFAAKVAKLYNAVTHGGG